VGRIALSKFTYTKCTWTAPYTPESDDSDQDTTLDWFISEVAVSLGGVKLCRLQNGIAHCCGATFLTSIKPQLIPHLDSLIEDIKLGLVNQVRWKIQPRLFFYLSDETVGWDGPIRNRQDVKELYSFMNSATRPYTPSKVTLFVLEFK
jgi:hypothetical protein